MPVFAKLLDVVGSKTIGTVASGITDVIGELVQDKDLQTETNHERRLEMIRAKVTLRLADIELDKEELEVMNNQIKGQTSVLLADAQSEDVVQKRWRPLLCLGLGLCVMHHYIGYDILQWTLEVFAPDIQKLPEQRDITPLLYLLGGVLGVYMPARTLEKLKGASK